MPASIRYVPELPFRLEAIQHFGDIDVAGLQIAVSASAVAVGLGLPAVEPAAWLYRLLFELAPLLPDSKPDEPVATVRRLVAWLPHEVQERALRVLGSGGRVAQETVGHKILEGYLRARQEVLA